jgi:hypothetical protein
MAKTKYITHSCAYCKKDTKMEFVGGQPAEGATEVEASKLWDRCSKCKHSALLTLSPAAFSKKNQAALVREECTSYSKEKTFTVGERIYHTEWDDMGKVVRKDKTSNGTRSILVSFEKLGERKLLENIQIETEEISEQPAIEAVS